MDFKALLDKGISITKDTIEKTKNTIFDSNFILKTESSLDSYISSNKYAIVILTGKNRPFAQKVLASFPILFAKSFASNYTIKIIDTDSSDFDLSKYSIEDKQKDYLISFCNGIIEVKVEGEENIFKVIKDLSIEIHTTLDKMK